MAASGVACPVLAAKRWVQVAGTEMTGLWHRTFDMSAKGNESVRNALQAVLT